MNTAAAATDNLSIVDEYLDSMLEHWEGLKAYLNRRRHGAAQDPVMERLLAEVLRINLGQQANIHQVVNYLENR